jgi:hypothetical protein
VETCLITVAANNFLVWRVHEYRLSFQKGFQTKYEIPLFPSASNENFKEKSKALQFWAVYDNCYPAPPYQSLISHSSGRASSTLRCKM